MKFKYIFIFLLICSNIAFAKNTFLPLTEYEKKIYNLNFDDNNKNSFFRLSFRLNLESVSNLDDATVIRMSKYDLDNNYIKNTKYPIETVKLLQNYKNIELTKLLIPKFNELNYESMQKIPLDGIFSHFYSEFIEAIANQSFEGKDIVLKSRLDYWLKAFNESKINALDKWDKVAISDCIMLLATTLNYYHKEILSNKEYIEITENNLDYPDEFTWLTYRYEEGWDKRSKSHFADKFIPLKSKFSDFSNLIDNKNNFDSLIKNNPVRGFDLSNSVGEIIYHENKALIQFFSKMRGGIFLLTIEGEKIIVKTLSYWTI